ncbi:MAG: hypothetical protein M3297_16510, partial [Thermoproteota archaeon]|nr:hypothetical protein [Thermoproteota archaeon]
YNAVPFFIIVAADICPPLGAPIELAAAQQFSMSHRILLDDGEGNTMEWNPKGNRISFTIFDNQFNTEISTVIVNTFQSIS